MMESIPCLKSWLSRYLWGLWLVFHVHGTEPLSFDRDIRPILSENCFHCHGFDENERKAKLRLDTRDGAMADLGGSQALVPGDPAASELIARIFSDDPDEVMPTPKSNRHLTDAQKTLLKQWVAEGGAYESHWAFTPPKAASIPEGENPVDILIEATLRAAQLAPNPPAPPRTLARRLALDLTGLPLRPRVLADFLHAYTADASAATASLIDDLLRSPHYGERMAWDWLDAARYADSNGFQGDRERTMWPWRDWVVQAYNRNIPFDQFSIWQLAGDLLPDATDEQKLATGFCRNYPINGEGGSIPEENRVNYVFDMTETMGTVWMGMTLECCRCHDHKFDPLSQKDYFSLTAFFNQTPVTGGGGDPWTKPVLTHASPGQVARRDSLTAKWQQARDDLRIRDQSLLSGQAVWESSQLLATKAAEAWQILVPSAAQAAHQMLTIEDDGFVLASGTTPEKDDYDLTVEVPRGLETLSVVRVDAAPHKGSGNFLLTDLFLEYAGVTQVIVNASASFEQGGHPVTSAFDEKPDTGWGIWNGQSIARQESAVFVLEQPLVLKADRSLRIRLRQQSKHRQHVIGRLRLYASDAFDGELVVPPDAPVLAALQVPSAERTEAELALLRKAYLATDTKRAQLQKASEKANAALAAFEKGLPKVMIMGDQEKARKTYVLERGIYNQPGAEVGMAIPEALGILPPDASNSRLDLARWLMAPEHPLTARVLVNRQWQQLFGTGLVKTSEDFGVQGERPSHPALLDHLAVVLIESGWDMQAVLRLILSSKTYQQSAEVSPQSREFDPENRLLSRSPRPRLPSWMLRDQALAASGLLVPEIGGEPVKSYQPAGIWHEATFGKKTYTQDVGDKLYRRTIYSFWRRISGPPLLFDSAKRLTCEVKPTLTNTPLHALTTLNDVTYVEAARVLAERALLQDPDPAKAIAIIFERATMRLPRADETARLGRRLAQWETDFAADPAAANELIQVGASTPDASISAARLAAMTGIANLVLNLDEVLCRP